MKDSKTSLRRSLPELTQSEPLMQQTLHLRSLIEWWQLAQHPDFTLDIQEWEHALREWKAANLGDVKSHFVTIIYELFTVP